VTLKFWLIVDREGNISVRKRTPTYGALAENEVAIPLTVRVPDSWFSRHASVLEIDVPEPPSSKDMTVDVGEVQP
jgi:hypothetical protein